MIVFSITFSVLVGRCAASEQIGSTRRATRPTVGAIRWDAWHGDAGEPGRIVTKTLSPRQYHARLPFFARVLGPNHVEISGNRQEIMEQEIAYAKAAGIDYWAFVWYEPDTSMSLGLKLYLSSRRRQGLRFCLITEGVRWGDHNNCQERIGQFVQLLRQPTYMTVLDGRPLVYLGFVDEQRVNAAWGSRAGFRRAIDAFRQAAVQAGLKNPYIVCMDFHPRRARELAQSLGLDAVSSYACPGGNEEGAPFAQSMKQVRQFWDACRTTGSDVVPIVSLGWDPRPRIDMPVPWHTYRDGKHYQSPTPEEAARHVRDALDWTAAHAKASPANTVIIYAWNEHDEGGWLVPTLNADGSANTERIEAIGRTLRTWEPPRP